MARKDFAFLDNIACTQRGRYVCVSECVLAETACRTDRDAVWRTDSWVQGAMNYSWDRDPQREGQVLGLSGPLKALGVSAAMHSVKGVIQSSITAWQRDSCSRLQCSRLLGVTLYYPSEISALCDAVFRQNSLTTCCILKESISDPGYVFVSVFLNFRIYLCC